MTTDAALDVVVFARDPARLDELSRTVFSVALQEHRPVTIHVVCGGFGCGQLDAVGRVLAPLLTIAGDAAFNIMNRFPEQGLQARYAAFIDCGSLIYPEAYRLLIAELMAGGAIAFGGILDADICRDGLVPVTIMKRRAVPAGDADRPLHSFVLDRHRIAPADLTPHDLTTDHSGNVEFLRRVCTRYPSSFRLEDKIVGERVLSTTKSSTT